MKRFIMVTVITILILGGCSGTRSSIMPRSEYSQWTLAHQDQFRRLREEVVEVDNSLEELSKEIERNKNKIAELQEWIQMPEVVEFELKQPTPGNYGGIFAHDLDGDRKYELIVTSAGYIGVYNNAGRNWWVKKVGIKLWEYLHHPSCIAGDMDDDGTQEIAYLSTSNKIVILDGVTGEYEREVDPHDNPVAMAIANLRGTGDIHVILQYSQTYIKALNLIKGTIVWETMDYKAPSLKTVDSKGLEAYHSPLKQADINYDGRDEILGANIIDSNGNIMNKNWNLGDVYKTMDSLVVGDFIPNNNYLEVAVAEQRKQDSHTDIYNPERLIRVLNPLSQSDKNKWEDPDKVAGGRFDPSLDYDLVFNRSSGGDGSCKPYECPWVIDWRGTLLAHYVINNYQPSWWHKDGIEEVCRINWDGTKDDIVAKERHTNGSGAIIDPLTGEFKKIFKGSFIRIYAVDIGEVDKYGDREIGDWREEVVTIDINGIVRIFFNRNKNPNPDQERYWEKQYYRRGKQNWNYYSP